MLKTQPTNHPKNKQTTKHIHTPSTYFSFKKEDVSSWQLHITQNEDCEVTSMQLIQIGHVWCASSFLAQRKV